MAQFPQMPESLPPGAPSLPPRPRGNGAAVASLVLGLLGCIPEVTGLLAIILGIVGLRRARDPNAGGRGLAAAGLTLGIVSVVLWSAALALFGGIMTGSAPAREVARQYLADTARQDIPALVRASTRSVTEQQIRSATFGLRRLGPLQDVRFTGIFFSGAMNSQWTLNGVATYSNGEATFSIRVIRVGEEWKVDSIGIQGHLVKPPVKEDNQEV